MILSEKHTKKNVCFSKHRKSSQRKLKRVQVSSPLLQFFKGFYISFGNTLTIPDAQNYLKFSKKHFKERLWKIGEHKSETWEWAIGKNGQKLFNNIFLQVWWTHKNGELIQTIQQVSTTHCPLVYMPVLLEALPTVFKSS